MVAKFRAKVIVSQKFSAHTIDNLNARDRHSIHFRRIDLSRTVQYAVASVVDGAIKQDIQTANRFFAQIVGIIVDEIHLVLSAYEVIAWKFT